MFALLLQGVAISLATWLLWKYFRQIVVKSPLDNVPGPAICNESYLYGHLQHLVDSNGWDFIHNLTESYNGIVKLQGPLGHRMLYVFDPVAMHNIVVKDQYIYEETGFFIKSFRLLLGPGLLGTLGEHHRKQRKMLNPVFSTTHMRRMNSIFNDIGHKLQTAIEQQLKGHEGPVELDMHSWISRTALELIGQAGLGYSFDPLVEAKPDEFASAIKEFQPTMVELSILRRILPYLPEYGSATFRRKLMEMIPNARVQKMKSIVDTIHRRSVEIFEEKKRALEQGDKAVTHQVGEGKDIMSILLKANMAASEEDRLPDEELIGQMSTFIMAGMDTTSNALVATLDLLAKNPDVQDKLRDEILEASKGGDLEYDALFSLPYLDAVCRETLRLQPTIGMMFKETRQDVVLPLGQPIRGRDGSLIHEIPVPKDTTVIIGIRSSNQNKAIWGEDALEWKPERWLSPLPATVTEAKIPGIYSHLMTFLGGGRACIGFKFSQHEMKIVLAVLTKFTLAPSEKPIFWNMSGVRYPTVGKSKEPQMPLVVGLYKPASAN
ncbi:cytochrome P450 [Daedaleopsis nitida]|nr:cytochrome P450 [Daedaleopsis nitida]